MISVTTLTMQLIDKDPDGIRICRVEGESLITVIIPRDKLAEAKKLSELPYRGMYYLLDEDHGVLSRVYAGQTTQGIARLDAHKTKKEFWNKAVMFLDHDNNIDLDTLNALEAKAIDYVIHHGSHESDNRVVPNPRLSPFKEEGVERLHATILFRMQVLGYDLNRSFEGPSKGSMVFHTKKNGIDAQGLYDKTTGKFTVLSGSHIDLTHAVIKNQLASDKRKTIFNDANNEETLAEDIEFPSPSAAAVFVLGGSQNGWTEWINKENQTLESVYRNKE